MIVGRRHSAAGRLALSERGFVLIGAVWLLLLAGAIAGALMLRGRTGAFQVSKQEQAWRDELRREAAIQTVAGDLLVNGPRGEWWLMPHEGAVTIEGEVVKVRVSNEAGRLDLNEANLSLIAAVLPAYGLSTSQIEAFVAELAGLRESHHRIGSESELRRLIGPLLASDVDLLLSDITISGGGEQPRKGQMSEQLARALGDATALAPAPLAPGDAVRIDASSTAGASLSMTARITGSPSDPLDALRLD